MLPDKELKIGVALTDPEDWTAAAFVKTIERTGAQAVPLNLAQLSASLSPATCSISDARSQTVDLTALIVRDVGISFALEQISFKFDLIRQFEAVIPVMNTSAAIQNAANKFYSFVLFQRAHLPIPRTLVTAELDVGLSAIAAWGSAIVKPIFGSQGKGIIMLSEEDPKVSSNLEVLLKERGVLYIQEFVPNPGRDIRVFVVGEDALGAMYRVSLDGSVISNLSQGGRPVLCELTEELRDLAVRATKAVGANFAGVDLIESEDGLLVLEVNGTPSGRGINQACGIDVTEEIVASLFEQFL
ncbi:MAG TPA: RimK family alpha-L-glutamate ligase [Methanomicrobia archaeon]|nr:RimK family alpha-L-glutamate ligase [Methanomicrobia archaeon]